MSDKYFETENLFTGLRGKLLLWLRAYLDDSNPHTFFRKTGAAREAGYSEKSCGSIGWQNYKKLQSRISAWMDDEGLSEVQLKTKLVKLLNAKKIVFSKVKGKVDLDSLPIGAFVVTKSEKMKGAFRKDEDDAEVYDDGDSIVAIPVEALETQRKALDMALKIMGLYAPEKHEVNVIENISDEDKRVLKKIAKELAIKSVSEQLQ